MALVLYNTRTRREEPFVPLVAGKISMYVCGITVYDRCHVGHARSLVFFDAMVRYLRWRGYDVHFVRNITDIEDKIIARANERGQTWKELTQHFIGEMHRDVAALGCAAPDLEPLATDHIPEMLEIIQALEARGLAYDAGGGDVYFAVENFRPYGALSGRNLDDLLSGARVDVDERKRGPMDFALWKSAKPGEPSWPSPWGPGRPGWHIECSAMSTRYLGRTFDIHGGGEDLIFPHHENELAQSCGAHDSEFARYWTHHAFVRIDKEKMSKSLGNIRAIQDVLEEVEAEGLRLHLLSVHYRSPLDFSVEGIEESTKALVRAYETLARVEASGLAIAEFTHSSPETAELVEAMDADLNSAKAVALLFDAVRDANRAMDSGDSMAAVKAAGVMKAVGSALGLFYERPADFLERYNARGASKAGLSPDAIEALIAERTAARKAKDFKKSDAVRDELLGQGIVLEDGPGGTTWRRA